MIFLFVIISLIGSVYNSLMYIKLSYAIWLASNVFLLAHNFRIGEYSQAFMYSIYLVTSVIGLRNSMNDGWLSRRK